MTHDDDDSNEDPNVERKDKLKPCECIKAHFNTKVKVQPCYENGKNIFCMSKWNENGAIHLNDTGIEDETIDHAVRSCREFKQQDGSHKSYSSKSKGHNET